MKADAKTLLIFLRARGIMVYEGYEDTLDLWHHRIKDKTLKFIYFDAEDMWISEQVEDIVGFDWVRSEFNVYNEFIKTYYKLSESEIDLLPKDKKYQLLYEDVDINDRITLSNKIMFEAFNNFKNTIDIKVLELV